MGKPTFYAATRSPSRDRAAAKAALDAFLQSGTGTYDGDGGIAAVVVNHCIERGITFELVFLVDRIQVRRIRA